jgi:hypothetical protein
MTPKGFNARLSGVLAVGLLSLLLSGCGFVLTEGPPTGHEHMTGFTCTESDAGPILDVVWAGLNVLSAAVVASDPDAFTNSDLNVVLGLGWAVFSSFSAASGFNKSKQCRRALQLLAQRQGQPGAATPALVPADVALVQAVVVTPSADTLAVGERVQLVATAHNSSGTTVPNREFTWSSSNDAIASVSNAGLVTAHAAGAVVIAASTGKVVGTASILVTAPR